ncbi:MAG: hypothetical protein KC493_10290, partial [Bacteriovoracaceae bacterium]|nr:hypothetical protein [Bacteriovoracaceae bacterium]
MKICLIIFLGLFTFDSSAQEETGLLYRPGASHVGWKAYEVVMNAEMWKTTALIDSQGVEQAFADSQDFGRFQGGLSLKYGIGKQLEARLGFNYRQNSSVNQLGDATSVSGLESIYGGLKYTIITPSSPWVFALDLQYRQTSFSTSKYTAGAVPTEELVLGDDGKEFTAGVHLSNKHSKTGTFASFIGFNMPPNDLSQEVVYDMQLAWAWTKWAWIFGVEGIYSLGTDDFASTPETKPAMATGSTALYNSINRERMMPYLQLNKAFSTWRLGLKGGVVVSGNSTDKGYQVGMNITWSSKGVSKSDRVISKFKEYEIEGNVL